MSKTKANSLIIASLRLPVKVVKESGKLQFHFNNGGGLATGVQAISGSQGSTWVGWPGIASDELTSSDKKQIREELEKIGCHPVFLTQGQIDNFYSGYCNATLWPLFHYFGDYAAFKEEYWDAYVEANHLFAKEIRALTSKTTQVWVHDYQLMLVPQMLREYRKSATIGFFLHTPFPSFEIFRTLPERDELLKGVMGADLVGFHTYDYVRHFLSSVVRQLGYESTLGNVTYGERVVKADAFPIGIDYKRFSKAPRKLSVRRILRSFDLFDQKKKVILSVDRLDYSKGILARLSAFELFLRQNPEYSGKVVLLLLAVPSRGGVEAYQELREAIEQKVSRINGEFATVDWSPITYRHQTASFEELSAMYSLADVMLVTPLRDGMNLVAKEYVANHHNGRGVLVLSEMAGAATEMPDALLVNPNNTEDVADAIASALNMSVKEQKSRMKTMQTRIAEYNVQKWASDFMSDLSVAAAKQTNRPNQLDEEAQEKLVKDYEAASKRLILLDYDGTLKAFVQAPNAHLAQPTARVKRLLNKLVKDKKNRVVIVSGRPKSTLESFFDGIGLGLIAEHGGWIFNAGTWIKSGVATKKWKKDVKPVLENYAKRTPRSVVEEKDFSLTWHYRRVTPDLGYVRKEELKMELHALLEDTEIGVFEGSKTIEVKPSRMHKGALVTDMIAEDKWDFIMAIGDDYTDSDMFEALPERGYSISVGGDETTAKYHIDDVPSVLKLISKLSKTDKTKKRKRKNK